MGNSPQNINIHPYERKLSKAHPSTGNNVVGYVSLLRLTPSAGFAVYWEWALINRASRKRLRDDVVGDVAVDVGETEVASCITVGELFVIDT